MKKLKLYGSKDFSKGIDRENHLAEVFVENGEVAVRAANPDLKRELEAALRKLIAEGGALLREYGTEKTAEYERYYIKGFYKTPKDEDFLKALGEDHPFWGDKKFDGYELIALRHSLVEE